LYPSFVSVNDAGTFAYVTNSGSDSVSVINLSTNVVTQTIPVGGIPYFGVATHPTCSTAYVTNMSGNSLSVIELATPACNEEESPSSSPSPTTPSSQATPITPATLAATGTEVNWFALGSFVSLLAGAFLFTLARRKHT
jgi:LPXTG-motif cell wall-anchored protein